jgi:hypothetical protein
MKIDIRLNGVKVSKNIPTAWDELTFRQLLALNDAGQDEAKIYSVFTGIDSETIKNAKIGNLSLIKGCLQFLKTPPIDYVTPKTILGYPIKDNVEIEEISRYADMETVLKTFSETDKKANLEKYPLIVATYVAEPYNFKDAENLAPAFLDAPAMEVLAVGNFIQMNILVLNVIMPTILHLAASVQSKSKRGMSGYIKRLGFSVFLFFLKRRFPSPVRNYLNGRLQSLNLT